MMDRNYGSPAESDVELPAPDQEAGAQESPFPVEAEAAEPAPEFEQVKADLQALQDRYLRQAAEFQNYRRRTDLERDALFDMGKAAVLRRMLNVLDDLGRSVEAAEKGAEQESGVEAYRSLREGLELVYRKFEEELAGLGVTPIEAVGNSFNEHEHEAVMQQPAPDGTEPGTVLSEFQKGYKLGDRVLRHSKVVVAA
ncbi:MAG TPA: nucleotide exchange factor GrpE [Rhodothermales bacterium]|nr:nucleotide exchange factor GrpE [Rhodothermales bacterium]